MIKNLEFNNYNLKRTMSSCLVAISILNLSACSETVKCDIEEVHSHLYLSEEGFKNYFVTKDMTREKVYIKGFERQEEYQILFEEDVNLINYQNKKGLIKIEDNKEVLLKIENNLSDYEEYQYTYTTVTHSGKTTIVQMHYAWTTNKNRSGLTGKERTMTHVFYGYKIINEDGKLSIEKSTPALSIEELINKGYTYVKKDNIYEAVDKSKLEIEDLLDNDIEENNLELIK